MTTETTDSKKYKQKHDIAYQKQLIRVALYGNQKESQKAKNELITEYRTYIDQLLWDSARHYCIVCKERNIYEDMVNECICEMLESLPKYNDQLSAPSSYLRQPIIRAAKKFINREILKSTTYKNKNRIKIKEAIEELNKAGVVNPTYVQISRYTGLKPAIVKKELNELSLSEVSYEECRTVADMRDQCNPEVATIQKEMTDAINRAITEELTSFQAECIRYLFGLNGYPQKTKEEIATILNVKPTAINQGVAESFIKLRSNYELRSLYKTNCEKITKSIEDGVLVIPFTSAEETLEVIDGLFKEENLHLLEGA